MEERRTMKPRPRKGRRKVCAFCADKVEHIDYKDVNRLRKFTTERGKIMPRRMACAQSISASWPLPSSVPVRSPLCRTLRTKASHKGNKHNKHQPSEER
mgnify:CR=1 FL=1